MSDDLANALTDFGTVEFKKGNDYLPWTDYFMSLCHLIAVQSQGPLKAGAAIISEDNKVVSVGYNGLPNGIDDFSLCGKTDPSNANMSIYVVHAAVNAIMNERYSSMKNCTLYINTFPCGECAKMIIQAGIKRVTYDQKEDILVDANIPAIKMFQLAGVTFEKHNPAVKELDLDLLQAKATLIKD